MKNPEIGMRTLAFYQVLQELNAVLTYRGIFDQEIVKSFLKMTESRMKEENMDDAVRKKLFAVMTEALQNICKHQKADQRDEGSAIFLLGKNDTSYFVFTGNAIRNDKIDLVRSKIDKVNSLDKEGLKEFYKQARLNSEISEVGGAGLGFIDMARKSGNRLDYEFEKLTADSSFFILLSTITIN